MHRVERSVLVPYTAGQMFELVAAVNEYPRFLPWCAGTHVRPRRDGLLEATIEIHYRGVRSRFTTCNDHRAPESIHMALVEGPFRRLAGQWDFRPLRDDACKVHLSLHYDFAPGLLGRAIAPVFESIAGSLVDSFTRRAEALYESP
ncbi:MAG: type II toxin-antitoxin system RatA family toxin [Burkholderiales bacterium]|jgi:ribosome-associated toxin RatA of RatAB toxin-antitoxin module|nr:type II toxin-antitoxin system RatA family toxin [Burkholderiales bacterium]